MTVRHPTPPVIADALDQLAATLRRNGARAIELAELLAARGWPSATLGDGTGSRGAAELTSVEAAGDPDRNDRWTGVDERLARLLRVTWATSLSLETIVADVLAHAQDVDPIPAGTGACEACTKVIRHDPTRANPERLRAGLCDACRKHWTRSGITDRAEWLLVRRAMLGHREGADALAARFTHALERGALGDTA